MYNSLVLISSNLNLLQDPEIKLYQMLVYDGREYKIGIDNKNRVYDAIFRPKYTNI